MALHKYEHYCTGCGFAIVTDYSYAPTCPICGEPLGHKKATSTGRKSVENKSKVQKEK